MATSRIDAECIPTNQRSHERSGPRAHRPPATHRILVVDNDEELRDSLGQVLDERGYEVLFADNGYVALKLLKAEVPPDLIILDLEMPVMDGWQFRVIQKDDPQLGLIPVLAMSADASPKAAAVSAQAYLHKPFDSKELTAVVERVLAATKGPGVSRPYEAERLDSLELLAANVGHEINNPLAFVMLYLRQSLDELRSLICSLRTGHALPAAEIASVTTGLASIADMLQECEVGGERIHATVRNLQQLTHRPVAESGPLDVRTLIEESIDMAASHIGPRIRVTKRIGHDGLVRGNRAAIGQVVLGLLINAAQSIPEGVSGRNDIQILTKNGDGADGREIVIEISDSGVGMPPDVMARIFEPYFTTKPLGDGTGLGLSIIRHTIADHGGRVTVQSHVGKGSVFRVFLPVDSALAPPHSGSSTSQNL
jgi:signal transduction histidine kinase